MPRQEFTRPEPKVDIYALMLVFAAVFILAATIMVYIELANDYDFGKETGAGAAVEEPIEVDTGDAGDAGDTGDTGGGGGD